MARSLDADIESQLKGARARLRGGSIDGELYDTNVRLWQLRKSLEAIGPSGDPELYRHFPVASIAVLESQFKGAIAAITNSGSPYLERGLQLAKERLRSAVDIVPLIHRKAVTIGELVAHVLPFNSTSSLENAFGALFNRELKTLIAAATDPFDVRNERVDSKPIVRDVASAFRALSLAFDRRHILAHEAATDYQISIDDARSDIESCSLFSKALDAILWATVWKKVPLTQYEMNLVAWESCKVVRTALAAKVRVAVAIAREDGERARFRQMHAAWKTFTKQWLAWESEPFAMGSIRPLLSAISQERALRARLESIDGWIGLMRPEASSTDR